MKILRPLFAMILLLTSLPTWACASGGRISTSACLRLCARNEARLTQDGKLASVGKSCLGIRVSVAQVGTLVEAAKAPMAVDSLTTVSIEAAQAPQMASSIVMVGRAPPPVLRSFVSNFSAQGPPALFA